MTYDNKNFDSKATAEARKAEMDEMAAKLEAGVKDVFQGDNYKKYLDFCSRLPRYSINNQILIMIQKPDATMCQSFTGWKEMGRFVKKGEKGIRVMAPSPYKMEREQDKLDVHGKPVLDKDGEPIKEIVEIKVNAFKPVSTFDVSQTEGDPVPTFMIDELVGSVDGYSILMEAIKVASPAPIGFEKIESGAKGYFHIEENRIAILEGMSEAQTVKTAFHEASHAMLHSKDVMEAGSENKTRAQKECEAESVAYVVSQHYGIDTSEYSFPYVAGWSSDKAVPELKASLDIIRKAAAELIMKIDEKVAELMTAKDMDKFMEAGGQELPFDDPEVHQPVGFISITPPVDISNLETSKVVTITSKEQKEESKETSSDVTKKKSVKEQIADHKEKSEKMSRSIKSEKKDLGEAI